jgi:hypothetical protein
LEHMYMTKRTGLVCIASLQLEYPGIVPAKREQALANDPMRVAAFRGMVYEALKPTNIIHGHRV